MTLINAKFGSDILPHFPPVSGKHDNLPHSKRSKPGNGIPTVFLYLVVDDDMSHIHPVHSYMYDSADLIAIVPFGAYAVHHLGISYADHLTVDPGPYTLSGDLLHIRHITAVHRFFRESITQGRPYRVCRIMLHMSGKVQKLFFIKMIRMDGLHLKLSVSKGTCLVKYDRIHFGKSIKIIAAFHQDSISRHYQENQRSAKPFGECGGKSCFREQRRDKRNSKCKENHDRSIYLCKSGDERLTS